MTAKSTSDDKFSWVKDASIRKTVMAEYQRIRSAMRSEAVEHARSKILDGYDFVRAARTIGIDVVDDERIGKPCVMFDDEEQANVLSDFAIMFDAEKDGPLRLEFAKRHSQSDDENLRLIASCYAHYTYAWLRPLRSKANFGVHCEDILTGREVFLVDRGLSKTLARIDGMGMLTGLHPFADPRLGCVMTGGAGLPVSLKGIETALENLLAALKIEKRPPLCLDEKEMSRFVAASINQAFRIGANEFISYE